MTGRLIRGRRRIAHELGVSERTISRWRAQGLLDVVSEGPGTNGVIKADLETWQPLGAIARRLLVNLAEDGDE